MLPALSDFRPKKFGTMTLLFFLFFIFFKSDFAIVVWVTYIYAGMHALVSLQNFHHVAIWLQLVIQISPYMQVITHALQRSIEHFLF